MYVQDLLYITYYRILITKADRFEIKIEKSSRFEIKRTIVYSNMYNNTINTNNNQGKVMFRE